jgi:phosphatidate cytidylyltransferase
VGRRALSSVGVVVVGLLPALVGGPVFALLMAGLGLVGYREFRRLCARLRVGSVPTTGYAAVVGFAAAGTLDGNGTLAVGVAALATGAPLVGLLVRTDGTSGAVGWALAVAGSLYLGLPVFAATALRSLAGDVDAPWLRHLAQAAAVGWPDRPRGLAWLLIVLLATWLGDTAAYLVGRSWGKRPLLPRVSPKKTVEGALGGLAGSALVGGIGVVVFGLGLPAPLGASVGFALGAVGQVGDLAESLLKRQAGVKDSGALIPGHGGMLDRVDALLFALTLGWMIAPLVDRVAR